MQRRLDDTVFEGEPIFDSECRQLLREAKKSSRELTVVVEDLYNGTMKIKAVERSYSFLPKHGYAYGKKPIISVNIGRKGLKLRLNCRMWVRERAVTVYPDSAEDAEDLGAMAWQAAEFLVEKYAVCYGAEMAAAPLESMIIAKSLKN